jgi:transposase
LAPWRSEGQERAFVRFETAPGEQAQMDWGHFGNWDGLRLYGFARTLCWSRMRYVEFTQRQDAETLLHCMVHAFEFFGGVTQTVLTDNMKTVVVDRLDGRPRFHPKMLDFASYYGFVPRVCRPYLPETKGKIESTIRFLKGNFWPGSIFALIDALIDGYIDADFLRTPTFPLQSDGGPYISATTIRHRLNLPKNGAGCNRMALPHIW